jgi:phosphopantetheinyl transferase (holo-ACP synthase)
MMNNITLKLCSLDAKTDARLNDEQWSNLFIPKHLHPNLALQKKAARLALYDTITGQGKKINFQQMEIIHNHYVVNVPGTLVSLTHTKDLAAAIIAKQGEIFSIGVDLERIDREVKAELVNKFKNEHDTHNLTELELWVCKEACFKALSPVYKRLNLKRKLILKDIVIVSPSEAQITNLKNETIHLEIELSKLDQHYLAKSVIKNNNYLV